MTLFIVVLVIYLAAHFIRHTKRQVEHTQYIKDTTSSAEKQYNYCCEHIEEFAHIYRHEAAKLNIEEYFKHNNCGNMRYSNYLTWNKDISKNRVWNCLTLHKEQEFINFEDLINNNNEADAQYDAPHFNIEKIWLTFTALACGYKLNTNYMAEIYSNDVWELIPSKEDKFDIDKWKKKFPQAPKDNELLHYIRISIFYKRFILKDINNWESNSLGEPGSSYMVYDNKYVLDCVAQSYNLPTSYELDKVGKCEYEKLPDVVQLASDRYIKQLGYAPLDFYNISSNPTKKEKEEAYSYCSVRELAEQEVQESLAIRKKYPDIM